MGLIQTELGCKLTKSDYKEFINFLVTTKLIGELIIEIPFELLDEELAIYELCSRYHKQCTIVVS